MVGNLHLQFGFEKGKEGKLTDDSDDAESYEVAVEYINEENGFNVGLLYNRTVASAGAGSKFDSENLLGIYTKKKWGSMNLGGEFVSRGYETGDAQYGGLVKILYKPASFSLGIDAGYASANGNSNYKFQSNYKPLLILFNDVVGPTAGHTVRTNANVGNAVGSGTGAGAAFGVLSTSYTFASGNYTLGGNVGYAQLVKQGTNADKALGTEVDLHLSQKWYDNFQTSYAVGMLFPGKGFGSDAQAAWGTKIAGALTF
jgi:hypothetical protein